MPQNEINDMLEGEEWVNLKPSVRAYINDFNVVERVQAANAVSHITTKATNYAVHAWQSEEIFSDVGVRAGDIGMVVNKEKTQLLCISESGNRVSSYIRTEAGDRIESGERLKILGFTFGPEPSASYHIDTLIKKFNIRLWSLRFLRRAGMKNDDLLFVYKALHRPLLDYATIFSLLVDGKSGGRTRTVANEVDEDSLRE